MRFAAVDAGSNAIRLVIAEAKSSNEFEWLRKERYAVRLGHSVFTKKIIEPETIDEAVQAFREIESLIEQYEVQQYRAVATSAAREAENGAQFLKRIKDETHIELEIIDGYEEARLVRIAVVKELGAGLAPRLIVDLGGGSLDLSLLDKGSVTAAYTLPIGTVRLMENFDIEGVIPATSRYAMEAHILNLLHDHLPPRLDLKGAIAVACGGNAEALQKFAPGNLEGCDSLDLALLFDDLEEMAAMDVKERREVYGVRRDRADVMAIAGIVLTAMGRMLGLEQLLVPGVGVRDGTLEDLAATHFRAEGQHPRQKA